MRKDYLILFVKFQDINLKTFLLAYAFKRNKKLYFGFDSLMVSYLLCSSFLWLTD